MGDCNCESTCIERSIAIYHTTGAAIGAGTLIPQATLDPNNYGNVYSSLSVINDTDQDIKVKYMTDAGIAGEFIVPESIKGFTRNLHGVKFDLATVYVISMHGASAAAGNITLNFGA